MQIYSMLLTCGLLAAGIPSQDGRDGLPFDADHPARGTWAGTLAADGDEHAPLFVHLVVDEESASVTAPSLGVSFGARARATAAGRRLVIEAPGRHFELLVATDSQSLDGRVEDTAGGRGWTLRCIRTAMPA